MRPQLEALDARRLLSASAIVQTNLVSDDTAVTPAQVQDTNLVNPWGLAASPTGEWWLANEGTGTSTLYGASSSPVTPFSLVVNVPSAASPNGAPTGTVYHDPSAGGFIVSKTANGTTKTNSSIFLFANVDGAISGWAPSVDLNNAIVAVPSHGAVYLGLAIATSSNGDPRLYAADFAHGTIDVYDQSFQQMTTLPGNAFADPKLPDNYHPFNIQAIGNDLFVEYAPVDKVLSGKAKTGDGAIDVYDTDGQLQQRLIRHGVLNDPWAVALAPANFGSFSNDLLVGNFGDGTINAFDPKNGHFAGELKDANGRAIAITHLWGLSFGNGGAAGPSNTLFFTAGLTSHLAPGDAPFHGLFGSLTLAAAPATSAPAFNASAGGGLDNSGSVRFTGNAASDLGADLYKLSVLDLDGASTIGIIDSYRAS